VSVNVLRDPITEKTINVLILVQSLHHVPALLTDASHSSEDTHPLAYTPVELVRFTPRAIIFLKESGRLNERVDRDEGTCATNPGAAMHDYRAGLSDLFCQMLRPVLLYLFNHVKHLGLHVLRTRRRLVVQPFDLLDMCQFTNLLALQIGYLQPSYEQVLVRLFLIK